MTNAERMIIHLLMALLRRAAWGSSSGKLQPDEQVMLEQADKLLTDDEQGSLALIKEGVDQLAERAADIVTPGYRAWINTGGWEVRGPGDSGWRPAVRADWDEQGRQRETLMYRHTVQSRPMTIRADYDASNGDPGPEDVIKFIPVDKALVEAAIARLKMGGDDQVLRKLEAVIAEIELQDAEHVHGLQSLADQIAAEPASRTWRTEVQFYGHLGLHTQPRNHIYHLSGKLDQDAAEKALVAVGWRFKTITNIEHQFASNGGWWSEEQVAPQKGG